MNKNARAVALEALLQVSENEGYSNIVIDKTLNKYELDKRDSALASIIFYGVLEKRIILDYYISMFLKHPNFTLAPAAREIFRISVYQMLFLEKIPESACVNEAVNLAKENKVPPQFVNGVLREFLRNKENVFLPKENAFNYLSVKYSIPQNLIDLWIESYGYDNTIKLLESFSEKSKTYIRVNNTKITPKKLVQQLEETINIEEFDGIDNACRIYNGGNLIKLKEFEDGLFHVQDISSQYLCSIVNPQENETLIDVCGAPGGKTFTLSERMNGTGTVYSYDIYKGRVKLIRGGAYRLGLKNVMASMRDATSEKCEISDADKILCDVPCSGFGSIRRKPEIRYKSTEDVKELPKIQMDILEKSAKHLKKGGILTYSTCTLNPAENGDVADKFLKNHPEFEAFSIKTNLERVIKEPENQFTMMPFSSGTDGFFVAQFKKI